MKSLAVSLIQHERIQTTLAKAKELRPYVEKLVTRGMTGTVASRRLLISRLGQPSAAEKLIAELGPKYKDRKGGYTRITRLPVRVKDGSLMAQIEFI